MKVSLLNLISISLVGFIWVWTILDNLEQESSVIQQNYLSEQKIYLKSIISNITQYVAYKRNQTEQRVQATIRNRVNEAIQTVEHLHRLYSGQMDKKEMEHLIRETIRPIRFNSGRGYFFALDLDGFDQLNADRPELEGKNILGLKSYDGKYVVKDTIDIATNSKEGFYHYFWTKPGHEGSNHKKIAFVKLFEPLGWVFGTGEYVKDTETDIKNEVLDRIATVRYGDAGYVFAGQWDGVSLSYPVKGKNMLHVTDADGVKIVQELISLGQQGGGYLTYIMPPIEGIPSKPKLAYSEGIEDWQWYIGAGVFIDELEEKIQLIQESTRDRVKWAILIVLLVLVLVQLFVMWVLRYYTQHARKIYEKFLDFFKDAVEGEAKLETATIKYKEVQKLADAANEMIIARQSAEEQVKHMAFYDPLTNLPNRRLAHDRLNQAILSAQRGNQIIGVLFIDLDRFKNINDLHGHGTGDKVLQISANRLKLCIRKEDTIARIGGDEFLIIVSSIHSQIDAEKVAQSILDKFSEVFLISDKECYVTASIGIAIWPINADDAQALLNNADKAMYRVKNTGRNSYHFFTDELDSKSKERVLLEGKLRHVLENDGLEVFYQPIIDTQTEEIEMAEALLRWNDKDYGFISPDRFIPIAEESNLINVLGDYVFHTACKQFCDWQQSGIKISKISINVSSRQFMGGHILKCIRQALNATSIDPHCITLEITESLLMENLEYIERYLKEIVDMGISISIDDFGTGYSSLSYLRRFPIKILKIDKSFISDLTTKSSSAKLVEAIVSMGSSLNIQVIAEGVEQKSQVEHLKRLKCNYIQGYYFGKPLPPTEFESLYSSLAQLEHLSS